MEGAETGAGRGGGARVILEVSQGSAGYEGWAGRAEPGLVDRWRPGEGELGRRLTVAGVPVRPPQRADCLTAVR
jgi:hypothetical protein